MANPLTTYYKGDFLFMERICNICRKTIQDKGLSAHLKKMHGVAFQDYVNNNLQLFPDYHKCENEACNNIVSPRKKACSKDCDKAIRKTKTGEKSNRYGKVGVYKHTEETKKLLRKKRVGRTPFKGKTHTNEAKKEMSINRRGEKNGMYGKTHKPETVEKIFKHRFKNKLEQLVCDVLDKNNIPYTFQFFLTQEGVCKSYDFYIHNTKVLLEVDGDYWHGNPTAKNKYKDWEIVQKNDIFKTELANKQGYTLIRLWESEIKQNPDIISNKLDIYI